MHETHTTKADLLKIEEILFETKAWRIPTIRAVKSMMGDCVDNLTNIIR